jgi:hypothetical protein
VRYHHAVDHFGVALDAPNVLEMKFLIWQPTVYLDQLWINVACYQIVFFHIVVAREAHFIVEIDNLQNAAAVSGGCNIGVLAMAF